MTTRQHPTASGADRFRNNAQRRIAGLYRNVAPARYRLEHGDVAVWGGPAQLRFHGVAPLADGHHPTVDRRRINLTLRKAL